MLTGTFLVPFEQFFFISVFDLPFSNEEEKSIVTRIVMLLLEENRYVFFPSVKLHKDFCFSPR